MVTIQAARKIDTNNESLDSIHTRSSRHDLVLLQQVVSPLIWITVLFIGDVDNFIRLYSFQFSSKTSNTSVFVLNVFVLLSTLLVFTNKSIKCIEDSETCETRVFGLISSRRLLISTIFVSEFCAVKLLPHAEGCKSTAIFTISHLSIYGSCSHIWQQSY